MASETLTNIIVKLGASSKELFAELANADVAISTFVSKANGILAGLDLGVGLAKYVKSFAAFGNDLAMFSASTGIAVEDVSRLGGALEFYGGNLDIAKSALESLQNAALKASEGTGPLLDISRKYGLELKESNGNIKDAVSLYEDLADVFVNLTSAQKSDVASNLGLDSSSIQLLQQGKIAVRDYMEEQTKLAGITTRQAGDSREWIMTITHLKQTLNSLGGEVASHLIPTINNITKFMADLVDKFRSNKELIDNVSDVIKNILVPAFVFAAAGIGKAMLPLMRSLLPLTIIALLINDISKFMQGGKSIIGDLFGEKGDAVREKIQNIFSGLSGIVSSILTGDFDKAVTLFIATWNENVVPLVFNFGEVLLKSILTYLPLVTKSIFELLPFISEFIMELFYSTIFSLVGGLAETVNSLVTKLGFDPIFTDKDGKAVNGSNLAMEFYEGFNYASDYLDELIFGKNGKTDIDPYTAPDIKRDREANMFGIKPGDKVKDRINAKPKPGVRVSLDKSGINPSKISTNNWGGVTNNFNTTINSTGKLDTKTVTTGVLGAASKIYSGLFNGLVATGRP